MRIVAGLTVLTASLVLAPGLFFYYDITPKIVIVFLGAAALAVAASLQRIRLSGAVARYAALAAGMAVVSATAALLSPEPSLAWAGSNWRRLGAVTEIALLVIGVATALSASSFRLSILRALTLAGFLASIYAVFQYFGVDPLIRGSAYAAGEGEFRIVRPPGTLGHSNYFGIFLIWALASGAAVAITDRMPWRWFASASIVTMLAALVLTGSRGAWLGAVVFAIVLGGLRRPAMKLVAAVAIVGAVVLATFYFSPAGARLRARAFWISEDAAGGARLLLWRDSAKMVAARPILGFGPDAFTAEFPKFQSPELSRAYPEFYHESPHNMFLDTLTATGVTGLALLLSMIGVALSAGWRNRADSSVPVLLAGAIGAIVAQQFAVFTAPTALLFYCFLGLLAGLPAGEGGVVSRRTPVIAFAGLAAVFFCWTAYRVATADSALDRVQRALRDQRPAEAAEALQTAERYRQSGVTADIPLARLAVAAVATAREPIAKIAFSRMASSLAEEATTVAEQRPNAWYNLAVMQSGANDAALVESSLRRAISASPNWFKPHWTLARLLAHAGRSEEARREALMALELGGRKYDEVTSTLGPILRSTVTVK